MTRIDIKTLIINGSDLKPGDKYLTIEDYDPNEQTLPIRTHGEDEATSASTVLLLAHKPEPTAPIIRILKGKVDGNPIEPGTLAFFAGYRCLDSSNRKYQLYGTDTVVIAGAFDCDSIDEWEDMTAVPSSDHPDIPHEEKDCPLCCLISFLSTVGDQA